MKGQSAPRAGEVNVPRAGEARAPQDAQASTGRAAQVNASQDGQARTHHAGVARPTRSDHAASARKGRSDHAASARRGRPGRGASKTATARRGRPGRGASKAASSKGSAHSKPKTVSFTGEVGQTRGVIDRNTKKSKPHKKSKLEQLIIQWCNRLLDVAHDRSFHEQEEQYEANRTSRDFLWNSIGMCAWGVVFPVLTIVVTQLSGATNAGMFSMAFVIASLLMIVSNFGIRTFQISDVNEEYSFADYRVNRVITCIAAIVLGALYCSIRGYDEAMSVMCMGLVVYKAIDGYADVYEGRLQQMNKMYLAGVSQTLRSLVVFVVFCVALVITGSLQVASVVMAVFAVLTLMFISLPLAHMETPKSEPVNIRRVVELFKKSWPLFAAFFMYALIDNMPKFVMEGALTYDNQLFYNALYFPAMFILMTAQTIYKPMLVRMANVWHDPSKRRRFDLIILAVVALIVGITAIMTFVMLWFGLDLMAFLYGLDFRQFEKISIIMLIAGGITAGIDFIYQTITILRRQRDVMMAYVVALILALFTPMLLIDFAQLEGAVLSYLIVMAVLFILMLWIYVRIRFTRDSGLSEPSPEPVSPNEEPGEIPIVEGRLEI